MRFRLGSKVIVSRWGVRSSPNSYVKNGKTSMKRLIAAAALIATLTGTALAQDIANGANVFKQC